MPSKSAKSVSLHNKDAYNQSTSSSDINVDVLGPPSAPWSVRELLWTYATASDEFLSLNMGLPDSYFTYILNPAGPEGMLKLNKTRDFPCIHSFLTEVIL